MEKKPLVSLIIANLNGRQLLKNCLDSLLQNTLYRNTEVLVVDSGSTDGSKEMVKKKFKQVKLIENPEKTYGAANNLGFMKSKGKYCVTLNNDTLFTPNWLGELVAIAESNEKIACVGSKLLSLRGYKEKKFKIYTKEKLAVCSAAMLFKRDALKKVGLFDNKNFYPIYGEETDWCYRARNLGFKVVETSKSIVIHLGSVETKKRLQMAEQFELLYSNTYKAMLLNLSVGDLIRCIPGQAKIFVSLLRAGMLFPLLKSYFNTLKNLPPILKERRKRGIRAK